MEKNYIVGLIEEEQKYLQNLIDRRSEKSAVVKRAYALQAADIIGNSFSMGKIKNENFQKFYS